MKKNISLIYLCFLIFGIFILLFSTNIGYMSGDFKNISIIVLLVILNLILLCNFGYKADKAYLKGSTTRTVVSALMSFMLITYTLGIILGFNKSYLVLDLKNFIINILPIVLITVGLELLRYLVLNNCFKNKSTIIIFTTLSIILTVLYELNIGVLVSSEEKFIFLCTIIFPIVAQEFLCSYMTYKIAMLPSLVFKLVLNLYIYIIPIVPDLGDYIYSILNIMLPMLIYFSISKMVTSFEKEKETVSKTSGYMYTVPLIILTIVVLSLTSGVLKYKLIAIASNSMQPAFSRGDAVIYEKLDTRLLSVGDVIAFRKENIVVTHRIIKIWKRGNRYYYTTKGDNNNGVDTFTPSEEDVLGRVKFSLKYFGYPSILVNEFLGKE